MKYQHVIWDWNGTLLDDLTATLNAVNSILKYRNMKEMTPEEYRQRITYPVIRLYHDAGFNIGNEEYEEICEEYARYYDENTPLMSLHRDAVCVLEWFRERNMSQHIVSASEYGILVRQLERYGIIQYFDNICGQKNKKGESKEHLAVRLISELGADPAKVLFIGDTVHDYEVAAATGADCCLVSNGHCSEERLIRTGAPVYPSLGAMLEDLKRGNET
jgi:haloacid dehalogenase-like hydrolase.